MKRDRRDGQRELEAELTRWYTKHVEKHSPRPQRRRRLTAKSLRKGRDAWSFRANDSDGERRTITIPFAQCPTLRHALKRANAIAAELNPESKPASLSFVAYVERHYAPDVLEKLGEDTQRAARSVLRKHAGPRFADCRLHRVAERLQQWVDDQHAAGDVASTIEHRVAIVKAVLAAARDVHGLDVGRIPRVRYPKTNRVRRTRARIVFNAREARRIIAAAASPYRVGYLLGLDLGLRPSEITGLAWEHVDFGERVLHVAGQSKRGEVVALKTEASHAALDIPAALLAELRALRTAEPTATFVLSSPGRPDEPMRTAYLRDRLAELCASLAIASKGVHALRRRFADALLEVGTPLHRIQGALRHASLQTTIDYLSRAQRPEIAAAIAAAAERFHAGEHDAIVVELATRRDRGPSQP